MPDIYLNSSQIDELQPLSDHSIGVYGRCYKYNDGVIKIFKRRLSNRLKNNISEFIKKDSRIVLYPRAHVYEHRVIRINNIGYYTELASGNELYQLYKNIILGNSDLDFDTFLRIFYDNYLPELRKQEVFFRDTNLGNIFIDDDLIYHIDTDMFYVDGDNSSCYKHNLKLVNMAFASFIHLIDGGVDFLGYDNASENYLFNVINRIMNETDDEVTSFKKYKMFR